VAKQFKRILFFSIQRSRKDHARQRACAREKIEGVGERENLLLECRKEHSNMKKAVMNVELVSMVP